MISGKIVDANYINGAIVKPHWRNIIRSFHKKIETTHINSASIDEHYHKIWDSNFIKKNSYKNNKFEMHIH